MVSLLLSCRFSPTTHSMVTVLMNIIPFQALVCPLDGDALVRDGSTWRCAAGHSFDVARQGYTHLLPVQQKRSRDPGDSKEMVAARQRFLNADFYKPIADAVSKAVLKDQPAAVTLSCLDAGCGEGYYLRNLINTTSSEYKLAILGLDISKWAAMSAAKQDKRPNWVVGSNANLPVQSFTLDRLLCIFGFPVYSEFFRTLKFGGQILQVDAGANHLRELREIIYPSLKPDRPDSMPTPVGFSHLSTETISYSISLTSTEQIADLLAMTPHLYRTGVEGRAKAAALTSLSVTIDVRLTCFSRDAEK